MTNDILIHRPIEDVYQYYVDVRNFAEWSESITRVEREREGTVQPGETFTVYISLNDNDLVVPHHVVAVEPGRRFHYRCEKPASCDWDVRFESVDGGTKMTVSMTLNLDSASEEVRKRLPPKQMLEAKEKASMQAIKRILDRADAT